MECCEPHGRGGPSAVDVCVRSPAAGGRRCPWSAFSRKGWARAYAADVYARLLANGGWRCPWNAASCTGWARPYVVDVLETSPLRKEGSDRGVQTAERCEPHGLGKTIRPGSAREVSRYRRSAASRASRIGWAGPYHMP